MQALVKFENQIKPKPSKAELIQALAIVKLQELDSIREDAEKEAMDLAVQCESALFDFCKNNLGKLRRKLDLGNLWDGKINGASLSFIFDEKSVPENLRSKLKKALEARNHIPRKHTLGGVKDQIKTQFANLEGKSGRVMALINSPKARAALEEALVTLSRS